MLVFWILHHLLADHSRDPSKLQFTAGALRSPRVTTTGLAPPLGLQCTQLGSPPQVPRGGFSRRDPALSSSESPSGPSALCHQTCGPLLDPAGALFKAPVPPCTWDCRAGLELHFPECTVGLTCPDPGHLVPGGPLREVGCPVRGRSAQLLPLPYGALQHWCLREPLIPEKGKLKLR